MLTSAIERGCFDQRLTRFLASLVKRSSPIQWHVSAIDEIVRQWRGNTPLPIDIPFQPRRVPICYAKFCRRRTEARRKILGKSRNYDPCVTRSANVIGIIYRSHKIFPNSCDITWHVKSFSHSKLLPVVSTIRILFFVTVPLLHKCRYI